MDNAKKRTIQSISVKAAIIQSKYNAKVLKVVNNWQNGHLTGGVLSETSFLLSLKNINKLLQSEYKELLVNNSIFLKAEKPDIMEDYDCAFISPKEAITTILFEILNPKQAIS